MTTIEIYTSGMCPFCYRAKKLLNKKGVAFTEYDVTFDPEKRREMSQRAGGLTSVPQIFVNGEYLSDCDGMFEMEFDDELDARLGLEAA